MSKKNITLMSIVAVFLAALIVVIGIGSGGFRNWNLATWFSNKTEIVDDNKTTVDDNKTTVMAAFMPTKMTFLAAENGEEIPQQELNITLTPDNSYVDSVDWVIRWSNDNAEHMQWSEGKNVNSYVTLRPASGDSSDRTCLTAYVSCLAPFGCPVYITANIKVDDRAVISNDIAFNNMTTLECKVDYNSRLQGFEYLTASYLNTTVNLTLAEDNSPKIVRYYTFNGSDDDEGQAVFKLGNPTYSEHTSILPVMTVNYKLTCPSMVGFAPKTGSMTAGNSNAEEIFDFDYHILDSLFNGANAGLKKSSGSSLFTLTLTTPEYPEFMAVYNFYVDFNIAAHSASFDQNHIYF